MSSFPILGLRQKPHLCNLCAWAPFSHGFCPDWVPTTPKLALLLEGPGENEVLQRTPLSGRTGSFVFHSLLKPLGLTRDDVLISNTIRCRKEDNDYPEGTLRKRAEANCRQYDWYHGAADGTLAPGGLADWDPQLFVITLHPAAIFNENAYFFLVRHDFEKAWRFASAGFRTCLLCGDKAASLVLPTVEGSGGVTYWRGHVFRGSLRTVDKPAVVAIDVDVSGRKQFRPVTGKAWGRRKKRAVAEQKVLF